MTTTLNASTAGAGGFIATGDNSGSLALQTAGTTAVTIDTSQNVAVGNTSPQAKLSVGAGTTAPGFGTASKMIYVCDTTQPEVLIRETGGSVVTSMYSDASTGNLRTATNHPLVLQTNNTERMRITNDGKVLVGTTLTDNPLGGFILYTASSNSQLMIGHETGTGSGTNYQKYNYAGTTVGTISQNGTTGVLYNLTSDYRLKNNPVALTGAKDFVMALQPKKWQWWDGSGEGVGFIAHEFMEVAKHSGQGEKDAVDADGKPIHQSIQPSSSEVMANIVALMQEQQALIDTQAETINALTARVVALESKVGV